MGSIQRQNFFLGVSQFQPCGLHSLNGFLPDGALFPAGEPYHLHGDGGAAAYRVPVAQVVFDGAPYCQRIHAGMPPEALVLKLDKGRGKTLRHGIGRGKTPLPVIGNPCPKEFSFGTFYNCGIRNALKQFPRQAQQPCQGNCPGYSPCNMLPFNHM